MREKKVCGQITFQAHQKLEAIAKTYSTSIAEIVTLAVTRFVADVGRQPELGWQLPADPRTKRAQTADSPSAA